MRKSEATETCARFLNQILVSEHDDILGFLRSRNADELRDVWHALGRLRLPGCATVRRTLEALDEKDRSVSP